MLSMMLRIILAVQLLTSLSPYVAALPITSRPIEGTAEQMAWQAWLMLPPEQKNLEKSRKVTPKSIFTLPNRSCPPGHQLFQSNCIPIVNIDEKELLTQQLLGFVVGETNANAYDYDDIGSEIADFIYEQSEKLSGDDSNRDTYQYDQLPSQDEPLKFNIFQQKFPTDYEIESMPSDEPPQEQLNKSNTTEFNVTTIPLAKAVNALTTKELSTNTTTTTLLSNKTAIVDLQMESSNISVSFAQNTSNSSKNSGDIDTPSTEFSVSDIDAIILPAVPTQNSNLESNKQNVHAVSLFKDDSSVQLVTSTLFAERNVDQQNQPDLSQLLKADDLLPLPNIASRTDNVRSPSVVAAAAAPEPTEMAATARTRTSSIYIDNDVSTLSTIITNGDDTTTLLSGNFTDAAAAAAFTTFPTTLLEGLYENDEKVILPEHDHLRKGEHPRSVKTKNETFELTAPQEENFTTTTEPDVTTNFQLDDTTVDEVHDAPTIAFKELLELAQHPSVQTKEKLGMVVKKSKVEPVEIPPIVYDEAETTTSSVMTTSTRSAPILTSTSTSATTLMVTNAKEVSPSSSTLVLETSTPSIAAKNDRFDNQQLDISTKVYLNQTDERQRNASTSNDEHLVDSNFRNTKTVNTTPTSEIDIKQELRMINELVKGNNNKRKEQSKVGIIKPERSSTTESRLTTSVKKPTKINVFSNSDKTMESKIKDTTRSKQQEEESITSTIKTISTQMTTTEATVAGNSTATMWSKIVPLFDFSTSQSTENIPSETSISSTTASPSTKSVSNDAINTNSNLNRSDRNSKIFRINTLDPSSFSDSDSYSNSKTKKKFPDKLISSTTTPETSTTTTTTELTDSSTTIKSTTSTVSDVENDPFWWLPIGWRLDRPTDVVNEPSLLLRLWSAFPESESTSKLRN